MNGCLSKPATPFWPPQGDCSRQFERSNNWHKYYLVHSPSAWTCMIEITYLCLYTTTWLLRRIATWFISQYLHFDSYTCAKRSPSSWEKGAQKVYRRVVTEIVLLRCINVNRMLNQRETVPSDRWLDLWPGVTVKANDTVIEYSTAATPWVSKHTGRRCILTADKIARNYSWKHGASHLRPAQLFRR
jgi:hypothetical protein